jgi:type I restriction enzyme, R subunit
LKKYLVQSRSFAEMLETTIRRYQNRTIEAAQVIAELIELAKQKREGQKRRQHLGLTDDEFALRILSTSPERDLKDRGYK